MSHERATAGRQRHPVDRGYFAVVTPPQNLSASTLFNFAVSDFEEAWDAMAERMAQTSSGTGGNFMFARQAMALLELTCRVASNESTGILLKHFSEHLEDLDRRYFTLLPGSVPLPREFTLPASARGPADRQLLAAIFDLVRHGQSHLYQQIPARLSDGRTFGITLGGVEPGRALASYEESPSSRPAVHLRYLVRPKGSVWLTVLPQILFLDVRDAARRAGVLSGGDEPKWLERPRVGQPSYEFTAAQLERALDDSAHVRGDS